TRTDDGSAPGPPADSLRPPRRRQVTPPDQPHEDGMSSNTPLLVLHLLGFAFGVGASTVLDLRLLRLLRGQPVNAHDLELAAVLSVFVRIGLVALWVSGMGFLLRACFLAPELLDNPKLHAKLAIVVVLTLNGILIELVALPLLRRQAGRCLFD